MSEVTRIEPIETPTTRGMEAVNDPPIVEEKPPTRTEEKPPTKKEEPKVEIPPTTTVDAKALAKEFGEVIGERFQAPKEKEEKPLTQEESEKLLNVWKPTKEWIAKFGNLETQEEAIKEMRDGMVKHTDTISQYRLREQRQELEKKFEPVLQYIQEVKERETKERFDKTYPQLADPALGPLLESVTTKLKETGKKYSDEKLLFDDIAKGVEAVVKVTNPEFKLSTGSTPAEKKPRSQTSGGIPVTTPGAGGGSAAKTTTTNKPRGLAIWDS